MKPIPQAVGRYPRTDWTDCGTEGEQECGSRADLSLSERGLGWLRGGVLRRSSDRGAEGKEARPAPLIRRIEGTRLDPAYTRVSLTSPTARSDGC